MAYFRRPEMFPGGSIRCPNCNQKMARKIQGTNYTAEWDCHRCKAYVFIKVREKIVADVSKKSEKDLENASIQ